MRTLYPPLDPYAVHRLPVSGSHAIHVEECGCPDGVPLVFLHGGPGSGCYPDHRRYFDPDFYRIVLFDQRGSGRSSPLGMTANNGSWDLVADMEVIRRALGINRWALFGGSWGATLALLYAQAHAGAVLGLLLRGSFLGRARDLSWFFGSEGVARLFPDDWERFRCGISSEEREDFLDAYYWQVRAADADLALVTARAWLAWEDQIATWDLSPVPVADAKEKDARRLLAKARIETHYAHHRYFLKEGQILDGAPRLSGLPMSIVHGRRDLVCPLEGAWALHRRVGGSRLLVVPDAGHLASEPAMVDALVGETDRMRDLLG